MKQAGNTTEGFVIDSKLLTGKFLFITSNYTEERKIENDIYAFIGFFFCNSRQVATINI